MPDEEKKTVDIDTSGPEVDVQLPEEKTKEEDKTYESNENNNVTTDSSEESSEQSDVRESKDEGGKVEQKTSEKGSDKQPNNIREVEEYSEGVKKRIAKLTKKMREAERQREEAIAFAQRVKQELSLIHI